MVDERPESEDAGDDHADGRMALGGDVIPYAVEALIREIDQLRKVDKSNNRSYDVARWND